MKRLFSILLLALGVTACANIQQAYKEAETVDQYAYVLIAQYDATLDETVKLIKDGAFDADELAEVKKAVALATPAIKNVDIARRAWNAAQNADNEAKLKEALAEAVKLVANIITLIHKQGSAT